MSRGLLRALGARVWGASTAPLLMRLYTLYAIAFFLLLGGCK
jgi:hypothetical protein